MIFFRLADGRQLSVEVAPGSTLAAAARTAGIPLKAACGDKGLCEGCLLDLLSGTVDDFDGKKIVAQEKPKRIRACRHRYQGGEVVCNVPSTSEEILDGGGVAEFSLPSPEKRGTLFRPTLQKESSTPLYGIALDIGTTTVAAALVDLERGEILERCSSYNLQIRRGADVISRIAAVEADGSPAALQSLLNEETLQPLFTSLLKSQKISGDTIRRLSVTGNTVMEHLFLGIDPAPIGRAPFTPPFHQFTPRPGKEVAGLSSLPNAQVILAPCIGGYLGGDLVAGMAACRLTEQKGNILFLDIGTNGEIALKTQDDLWVTSAAAGPAFEGYALTCGCRNTAGAIEQLTLAPDTLEPFYRVAGGGTPTGLCGTGYIDFLAEGWRQGLLNEYGRFDLAWMQKTHRLQRRDDKGTSRLEFLLATKTDGTALVITESDLAALLLAKGAITAATTLLLQRVGLRPEDLDGIYLAGGFGKHIQIENAMTIGLLPRLLKERVTVLGNTSLAGAIEAMTNRDFEKRMADYQARAKVLEIHLDPDFSETFNAAIPFPAES